MCAFPRNFALGLVAEKSSGLKCSPMQRIESRARGVAPPCARASACSSGWTDAVTARGGACRVPGAALNGGTFVRIFIPSQLP